MTPTTEAMVAHLQRRESDTIAAALRTRLGYDCTPQDVEGRLHQIVTPGGSTIYLDGEPLLWIGKLKITHDEPAGTISVDREWRMLP